MLILIEFQPSEEGEKGQEINRLKGCRVSKRSLSVNRIFFPTDLYSEKQLQKIPRRSKRESAHATHVKLNLLLVFLQVSYRVCALDGRLSRLQNSAWDLINHPFKKL